MIYRGKEILEIRKLFKYQWQSNMEMVQNQRLGKKKKKDMHCKEEKESLKEGKVYSKRKMYPGKGKQKAS